MKRRQTLLLVVSLVLVLGFSVQSAMAQIGDGSLTGYVRDEQQGALPGVTITATSDALITARTAVTDARGYYRLANLPPGAYTLTGELTGFSVYKQEGIRLRAGANFAVDMVLTLGAVEETITVTAESPMLEVTRPSNLLNIDGEFQREIPISTGKYWSDFLELTPGVFSRPHNDGSGRQNYFGNAVDHRDAVLLMEGLVASNYNDSNVNRTGLSTSAIEDTQVKIGGMDASAPMGYGLVINAVSKSGGNTLSGSLGWTYQGNDWNADNTGGEGVPATRAVNQTDFSIGGPIVQDKAWFFGAGRFTNNETNSAKAPERTATLEALSGKPPSEWANNDFSGFQPFVKVTGQLSNQHTLSGVWQNDRLNLLTTSQIATEQLEVLSTGGDMFGGKLVSVWGDNVTSNIAVSYNNKSGNTASSYDGHLRPGPSIQVHETAEEAQGILEGSGVVAEGGGNQSVGCVACLQFDTASVLMLRGDVTWYKENLAGSHTFETGFFLQPQNKYYRQEDFQNNGFILEEHAFNDPNDPSAGTHPFHRQYITSDLSQVSANGKDGDNAFYVQDTWKPTERLTATLGVRFDIVRRTDLRRDFQFQSSTEIGPRLGVSYLLTEDARNVVRASFGRVHEQLQGGRHPVSEFGGAPSQSLRDEYDVKGDGSFSSVIVTPALPDTTSREQYANDLSQPYFTEFVVGFRRQFEGEISLDVAGVFKTLDNQWGQVDINGMYPSGPYQPFIGFGLLDPNQGVIAGLRNNNWSTIDYRALQITAAKNMSRGFQAMIAVHKQWQHLEGTWNPTDPAGFIQPDAFANNKLLHRTRGPSDTSSLPGSTTADMWFPYAIRMAGAWQAPMGVLVSANWSIQKPSWSNALVDRLSSSSPDVTQFGPSSVTSVTGSRQSNPLARRERFVCPDSGDPYGGGPYHLAADRSECQVLRDAVHQIGIKLTKSFRFSGTHEVVVGGNILNLFNGGNGLEWARGGANRIYAGNTIFLQPGNLQPPRSFQLELEYRF